jgi:hypothetical protein
MKNTVTYIFKTYNVFLHTYCVVLVCEIWGSHGIVVEDFQVVWDVTPCWLVNIYQGFAGLYCLSSVKMSVTINGKEAVSHTPVLKLFKREGHEDPKDVRRNGWPLAAWNLETVNKIHELVARDHSVTLKLMEDQVHVNCRWFEICALLGYYIVSSGNPLSMFQDFLILEDGTDTLSRNVGKGLPLDAA